MILYIESDTLRHFLSVCTLTYQLCQNCMMKCSLWHLCGLAQTQKVVQNLSLYFYYFFKLLFLSKDTWHVLVFSQLLLSFLQAVSQLATLYSCIHYLLRDYLTDSWMLQLTARWLQRVFDRQRWGFLFLLKDFSHRHVNSRSTAWLKTQSV